MEKYALELKDNQRKKNMEYRLMGSQITMKASSHIPVSKQNEVKEEIVHHSVLDIKFDERGPKQCTYGLLGSSKSGKSTVLAYIFNKYYNDHSPNFEKVTDPETNRNKKDKFISCLFSINSHIELYKDFDIKTSYVNKRTLKIIQIEHAINKATDNHYNFFNAFDDVLTVRDKGLLSELVLTYRNSNMSTAISLQHLKLLTPAMRSNINHIFCFKFNSEEIVETIIKVYLRAKFKKMGYITLSQQVDFYNEVTKNHGFIHLDMMNGTMKFYRLQL